MIKITHCPKCKKEFVTLKIDDGVIVIKKVGCPECDTEINSFMKGIKNESN